MSGTHIHRIVVVGAGTAGAEAAVALRQGGFAGSLLAIGEEPFIPYHRPPLSKAYLSGECDLDSLRIKPRASYETHAIEMRLGTRVTRIDRRERAVELADGDRESYDVLILATGGRARQIPLRGLDAAGLSNVHYLRTIHDADRIRRQFQPGFRLLVVGGGYIGLEVAAIARKLGLHVTVLETLPRVLARVTAPAVSAFYESVHREAGVDLRTGTAIAGAQTGISGDAIVSVNTTDGSVIPVDVMVVGIGLEPNTELAEQAALAVDNGILVDEHGRTSDPLIFAIGDSSNHPNGLYESRVRLESVPHALAQARAVAATLCGNPQSYDALPWFWSDQYDLKLQIAGLSRGYDRVIVRGDQRTRSFVAFYLLRSRVIAADAVNRPKDFMIAKRLIAERATLDDAQGLADEALSLHGFLH